MYPSGTANCQPSCRRTFFLIICHDGCTQNNRSGSHVEQRKLDLYTKRKRASNFHHRHHCLSSPFHYYYHYGPRGLCVFSRFLLCCCCYETKSDSSKTGFEKKILSVPVFEWKAFPRNPLWGSKPPTLSFRENQMNEFYAYTNSIPRTST